MNNLFGVFKNKTVLVTGHTGFKGSWLCIWLNSLGAKVIGISIDIPSTPSNFIESEVSKLIDDIRLDIRDSNQINKLVIKHQPDFIFHLAAQALVKKSYDSPIETLTTNAIGTANILEAARKLSKKVALVMITSDKVYENQEWVWGYRETDNIGGKDPYSASKGMAELAINTYLYSFYQQSSSDLRVGIARAGNVIGGGDWAFDRLVPDCMRAWSENQIVEIRNPRATRPWQHVLEPLSGYLTLASHLSNSTHLHGEAFNFGPHANQNFSVNEIINEMSKYWDYVRWLDVSDNKDNFQEAGLLKLNCDKALFKMNWTPVMEFNETVKMTVQWYKFFYEKQTSSMLDFTLSQIKDFSDLAKNREVVWAKAND